MKGGKLMEWLSTIVDNTNTIFWTYILIILLLVAGLYFSVGTKFLKIRFFPEIFQLIVESGALDKSQKSFDKSYKTFDKFTILIDKKF